MKQGSVLTKIIFVMLLLALIVYAVCAAVSSMGKAITTVAAITYEVGDGFQATGFVVRDETVLSASGGISVLLREEGERVAKGEILAATYADANAQEAQQRIDALEQELEQYEAVLEAASVTQGNTALDNQIQQNLLHFSVQTVRGNLNTADSYSNALKTLVLQRYLDDTGREAMQSQAQDIRAELANLRTHLVGAVTQRTAECAGYFSGSYDGYEQLLTPKSIMTMSPEMVENLSSMEAAPLDGAIGRLILSPQWYFVCAVPAEKLKGCSVGDWLQVELSYDVSQTLSMCVERISDPVAQMQVLVLSCEDYMADVACLREQTADIAMHTYSGLRIPKQALRFDNDSEEAGVFTLEGVRVKWKPVEIIYETTDYYLVRQDKSSTDHLWSGDEIIVTTMELSDGKVIE